MLQVERHVEAINALGANAIVMLGDLVDDQVEDIRSIVDPISGFSASDGQFFVLGWSAVAQCNQSNNTVRFVLPSCAHRPVSLELVAVTVFEVDDVDF